MAKVLFNQSVIFCASFSLWTLFSTDQPIICFWTTLIPRFLHFMALYKIPSIRYRAVFSAVARGHIERAVQRTAVDDSLSLCAGWTATTMPFIFSPHSRPVQWMIEKQISYSRVGLLSCLLPSFYWWCGCFELSVVDHELSYTHSYIANYWLYLASISRTSL